MKSIFDAQTLKELIGRINKLTPETQPLWGKMNVTEMLAHTNVSFELTYDNIHPAPSKFKKFFLKLIVKKFVVSDTPYKRNTRTAPVFLISDERDFEIEKDRLRDYIKKTQELGANYFDGRDYYSFGILSSDEWNNLLYKHVDHHLTQFGV